MTFEEETHHYDLELCPDEFPGDDVGFCRGVLDGDDMVVYFFKFDDENDRSCLTQMDTVDLRDYMAID